MRRQLIKIVLIAITFVAGMLLFSILRMSGAGTLILFIIMAGMVAAIRAIWRYSPESKEISLKKDN